MNDRYLYDFVEESNAIEGILEIRDDEVKALKAFIDLPKLTLTDVSAIVTTFQPNAVLRDKTGRNVMVGNHFPPRGGPDIKEALVLLLDAIELYTPFHYHVAYEKLHPFTDGNGRSGRAIWLWHMRNTNNRQYLLGFKHAWYYQSLSAWQALR